MSTRQESSLANFFKLESAGGIILMFAAVLAGAQPNFGSAHLEQIKMTVLEDIKEQTCIASIISNMDNEITALETKLTKAQQIKQGMMQNLLTGRIRLI